MALPSIQRPALQDDPAITEKRMFGITALCVAVGSGHPQNGRRRNRRPRLARDLATLIGQHDVLVRSASYGDGRSSEQISLRRQDIMQAADVRALAPGTALLFATGARPAMIQLWYTGPDQARIAAATARAEEAMRDGARRRAADHQPERTYLWPVPSPAADRER